MSNLKRALAKCIERVKVKLFGKIKYFKREFNIIPDGKQTSNSFAYYIHSTID